MRKLPNFFMTLGLSISTITATPSLVYADENLTVPSYTHNIVDDGFEPPTNPHLAYSPWPMSHRNPYSQGSSPLAGPELTEENLAPTLGKDFERLGNGNIVLSYSSPYEDGSQIIWGSTVEFVFKINPNGDTFETIATLPREKPLKAESSAYVLLDKDNQYYLTSDASIKVYADAVAGDPNSSIELIQSYTIPDEYLRTEGETIVGMNMTYDGHIVFVTCNGLVGLVSSDFSESHFSFLDADEEISNSVSLDEDGGIYVVTNKYMRRLQWTGSKLSQDTADGAWASAYETGPETPLPGRLGTGSGTTPSLMGTGDMDKFVVIGDGQEQMNLVLFWRDEIPADWKAIAPGVDRRIAAQVPITFGLDDPSRTTTEQSVLVRGYSAAVVSNDYKDLPDTSNLPGILSKSNVLLTNLPGFAPYGVEKFTWSPNSQKLKSDWTNPEISCPNAIPTMSVTSNLMYCWGQRDAVWTLEAMDWDTGKSVFHKNLGLLPRWNSAYAATEIGLDQKIVTGSVGGVVRLQPEAQIYTHDAQVRLNGEIIDGYIPLNYQEGEIRIDAEAFAAKVPELEFYKMPIPMPIRGTVMQYGKKITFAGVDKEIGFSSMELIDMEPPLEIDNFTHWVPAGFLANAVNGSVTIDENSWVIDVTAEPASQIGSIIPEAKDIADQLDLEFDLRQGEITLTNAVKLYATGYLLDSNGNNAKNSYLVVQNPISPRAKFYNRMPMGINMDQDEALVWVGYTPAETKYFSYQNYLVARNYIEYPPSSLKLYARMSDSVNNYNISTKESPYNQFHVFVIASNLDTREMVTQGIVRSGISADRIVYLDIPSETGPGTDIQFGVGPIADTFNFLHRASLFTSDEEKAEYINNVPLEIIRVTPKTKLAANPIPRAEEQSRITGVSEKDDEELGALIQTLQERIIETHGKNYKYAKVLGTSTWLYPGGDIAIEEREDVLGETNDTLYLKSAEFTLNDDDLIVAFGPNHTQTGKSVYSNVSMYGSGVFNGIGGISSIPPTAEAPSITSYYGSAEQYMPDVEQELQEKLYAYKFSRTAIDENTFVVPDNSDGSYEGFDAGTRVFMGLRSYVDKLTTVGPYPGDVRDGEYFDYMGPSDSEVYFDQIIVFTNSEE